MIVAVVSLAGIYLAYLFFGRRPAAVAGSRRPAGFQRLAAFALAGWGFDRLYDVAFVRPFLWLARHGQGRRDRPGVLGHRLAGRGPQRVAAAARSRGGSATTWPSAAFGVLVFVARGGAAMSLVLLIVIPFAGGVAGLAGRAAGA